MLICRSIPDSHRLLVNVSVSDTLTGQINVFDDITEMQMQYAAGPQA